MSRWPVAWISRATQPTRNGLITEASRMSGSCERAKWCPGAGSNHRHCDFQSHALPTELPGHCPARGPGSGRFIVRPDGRVYPASAAASPGAARRQTVAKSDLFRLAAAVAGLAAFPQASAAGRCAWARRRRVPAIHVFGAATLPRDTRHPPRAGARSTLHGVVFAIFCVQALRGIA